MSRPVFYQPFVFQFWSGPFSSLRYGYSELPRISPPRSYSADQQKRTHALYQRLDRFLLLSCVTSVRLLPPFCLPPSPVPRAYVPGRRLLCSTRIFLFQGLHLDTLTPRFPVVSFPRSAYPVP